MRVSRVACKAVSRNQVTLLLYKSPYFLDLAALTSPIYHKTFSHCVHRSHHVRLCAALFTLLLVGGVRNTHSTITPTFSREKPTHTCVAYFLYLLSRSRTRFRLHTPLLFTRDYSTFTLYLSAAVGNKGALASDPPLLPSRRVAQWRHVGLCGTKPWRRLLW